MIDVTKYTAHQHPGKFEGECAATEYFYEQMLNGDGDADAGEREMGGKQFTVCVEVDGDLSDIRDGGHGAATDDLAEVPALVTEARAYLSKLAADTAGTREQMLCDLLKTYCDEQHLPCASADEMLHNDQLTDAQRAWLTAYVAMWEANVDADVVPVPAHTRTYTVRLKQHVTQYNYADVTVEAKNEEWARRIALANAGEAQWSDDDDAQDDITVSVVEVRS